jgi:hypothetical protein
MVQTRELTPSELDQVAGGLVLSGVATGFLQGAASGGGPTFPIGPTGGGHPGFFPCNDNHNGVHYR